MDFLNKMLDLESRTGGDLFLQERQLFAAFLIAIINLDRPAGNQTAADQNHRDQKIIAHEPAAPGPAQVAKSEEHTSELQSPVHLVCRLLLEKKKKQTTHT